MANQEKVEQAVYQLLEALGENPEREGLLNTPKRVAKMYAEMFSGLNEDPKDQFTAVFSEVHDEVVLVKDIPFYSMCEHHLLPFFGTVDIVYQPKDGCVAGLSKFQDIVNILSRRPQLQERLASELADAIMNDLSAHGVFVRITSTQLCMLIKGTMQQDSKVITLESRGVLAETGTLRDEALAMLGGGQANV